MAVESLSDLNGFVNPDEFGVHCFIVTAFGQIEVNGIFDEAALTVEPTTSNSSYSSVMIQAAEVTTTRPLLLVPTHQLQSKVAQDDEVTIGEARYVIADIRKDGEMSVLLLHQA